MKTSDRSGRVHVIATVLILAAATIGFAVGYFEHNKPKTSHEGTSLTMLGLADPVLNRLNERFTDADGDLVADAPDDAALWMDPEVLLFSYVAAEQGDEHSETVWKQFVEHIAAETGKRVEYVRFANTKEQLLALKNGRLHIAGLNTGNVPLAVNDCGFIPVCTFGNDQGMMEYVMNIIVPAQSPLQSVADLRNHTLALTHPNSNSGFKAPLVILMNDFGMQVERDYLIRVTRSHDASIKGIAANQYEAAAVASDMVTRAISRGDVKQEELRVIYDSERFANAALGYAYNLNPELARQLSDAMYSFEWAGTGVSEEFSSLGADRFVPIDYKNDWALIRRIDDTMGNPHVVTEEASLPESADAESIEMVPHRFAVLAIGVAVSLTSFAQDGVRERLNDSPRHHEWVHVESAGREIHCFVVYPEVSARALAVLVIHENKGLTDWVRGVCDQLAERGHIAIAPDLLSGKGPNGGRTRDFPDSSAARDALYQLDQDQTDRDLVKVADYVTGLPAANGTLAVAGFCWGGRQAWRVATQNADLAAAFVFYGTPPKEKSAVARIECPVYGFYGERDNRVNASLPDIASWMQEADRTFEPVVYDGAGHGFMRAGEAPDADEANRTARDAAWKRWTAILQSI